MAATANQELCKQPTETRKFSMEFGHILDLANTEYISSISSVTSETISGGTTDLTISLTAIDTGIATDSKVNFWVAGGTAGNRYRIEVLVVTSAGQILEGDGILKVTDK